MSEVAAIPVEEGGGEAVYPVERRRYLALTTLCLVGAINTAQWVNFTSIVPQTKDYFNVNTMQLNWLNIVYNAVFIVACPLTFAILEGLGLRWTLLIASLCNTVAAVFKIFIVLWFPNFGALLATQVMTGVAQVLFLPLPPTLACVWFPVSERTLAVALASLMLGVGTALAMLYPPFVVPQLTWDKDTDGSMTSLSFANNSSIPANNSTGHDWAWAKHEYRTNFTTYFLIQAAVCVVETITNVVWMRERPAQPPSKAATMRILEQQIRRGQITVAEANAIAMSGCAPNGTGGADDVVGGAIRGVSAGPSSPKSIGPHMSTLSAVSGGGGIHNRMYAGAQSSDLDGGSPHASASGMGEAADGISDVLLPRDPTGIHLNVNPASRLSTLGGGATSSAIYGTNVNNSGPISAWGYTRNVFTESYDVIFRRDKRLFGMVMAGGFGIAALWSLPATLCELLERFNIDGNTCGEISFAMIILGLVIGGAISYYVDVHRVYRLPFMAILGTAVVGVVGLLIVFVSMTNIPIPLLVVLAFLIAVPLFSFLPISLETAVEETFPLDEIASSTVMMLLASCFSIPALNAMSAIMDAYPTGTGASAACLGICLFLTLAALVSAFPWRPNSARSIFEGKAKPATAAAVDVVAAEAVAHRVGVSDETHFYAAS